MPIVGFTRNKVVDGMIKGGLGWLTKPAIFTWCGRYPCNVLHADNMPHVEMELLLKYWKYSTHTNVVMLKKDF